MQFLLLPCEIVYFEHKKILKIQNRTISLMLALRKVSSG
jgi:hypothetical protein